eukprot:2449165-Heterocapsa_arctica.AAC.1
MVPPTPLSGMGDLWGLLLSPIERSTPGKTGLFDEAIMLDGEPPLHPLLARLVLHRAPHERLWTRP